MDNNFGENKELLSIRLNLNAQGSKQIRDYVKKAFPSITMYNHSGWRLVIDHPLQNKQVVEDLVNKVLIPTIKAIGSHSFEYKRPGGTSTGYYFQAQFVDFYDKKYEKETFDFLKTIGFEEGEFDFVLNLKY